MPQLQATITRINSSVQSPAKAMTFPVEDLFIRQNFDGGCILDYKGVLHYCDASVSATAGLDMLVATVRQINGSQQLTPFTAAFPAAMVEMQTDTNVSGANAVILFRGNRYYVQETLSTLLTDANVDADTTPTSGSTSPVQSGGVYAALNPVDRVTQNNTSLEVGAPAEVCTANIALSNQRLWLIRFSPRRRMTVNAASFCSDSTAAGATPSLVRFGLYAISEDLQAWPLSRTTNDTTIFSATMTKYTRSFADGWAGSVTLIPGRVYAVGVVINTAAVLPTLSANAALRTVIQSLTKGILTGAATDLVTTWNGAFNPMPQVPYATLEIGGTANVAKSCVLLGDSFFGSYGGWFGLGNAQGGARLHPLKNAGVGGQTLAQMYARWSADVVPYAPEYVVLHGGTNDLFSEFATSATVISRFQQIIAVAQAAAYKLIICTPPSNTAGSAQAKTYLSEVRAWLLALSATGVTVADTGITLTTGDGVTADAAKLVDTVHPNTTGQQAMADVLDNAIAAIA